MLTMSEEIFERYQKVIKKHSGIVISSEKKYLVESRLVQLLTKHRIFYFDEFIEFIEDTTDASVIDEFIDCITINETSWMRDTAFVSYLDIVIPKAVKELKAGKDKVRIWSAACSTGQEPYSIAIYINEFLRKNLIRDITLDRFEILATDLSTSVLKIAESGMYDKISIKRGLSDELREKYFKNIGNSYLIDSKIQEMVKFKRFNLMNNFDSLKKFDIILCRYVLIYFEKFEKQSIMKKMSRSLLSGGSLLIGAAEIYNNESNYFEPVPLKNGVYFKSKDRRF